MRCLTLALIGGFVLFAAMPQSALAEQSATLKTFFGEYEGTGITSRKGTREISFDRRDLDVVIKPYGENGFTVTWTTVISLRHGQKWRKRTTTVNFMPTKRADLWRADPLLTLHTGKPVIWARIVGDALHVYVVAMTEEGGIATSIYKRFLTRKGMRLEFHSTRDGRPVRTVQASLRRKK